MTTNPTNIKLETPVSFCYYWFSFHLPIHVGLHSQHNEWLWAGRFATDLSLLQNIQTSTSPTHSAIPLVSQALFLKVGGAQVSPLTSTCCAVNMWTYTATEERAA